MNGKTAKDETTVNGMWDAWEKDARDQLEYWVAEQNRTRDEKLADVVESARTMLKLVQARRSAVPTYANGRLVGQGDKFISYMPTYDRLAAAGLVLAVNGGVVEVFDMDRRCNKRITFPLGCGEQWLHVDDFKAVCRKEGE